jgi:hypothetical protein
VRYNSHQLLEFFLVSPKPVVVVDDLMLSLVSIVKELQRLVIVDLQVEVFGERTSLEYSQLLLLQRLHHL